MNQQTCNPAWLDAFLKNDLNQSEEQMLTSHLDECPDCREELESRAAEQSVWREASSMLGGGILLSTAAISDIRCGTVCSPQIELVLKQLAPTDDPESLGRIGGYEVTGVVGAGGMGVVLKAHDRSLDRIVAIKVMSPHLASSGSARRRFAREAKAAAAVLHPNVIAIHSVASEDANPYLVMPYVRGASLQKRIDSQGPLPLKDTLRIGAQIAAGLAAAHEQGLVHRDIKPANILLEEGVERVTITDFGLARAVDDASMTCSGVIAGTPQYMSPEQTRGEPIDARSDLFSLGTVLYAMCAGRSPFRAETTYGVLHRIANDNPTPVCEVNSDVPEWLGHIIERLMAKRPEDRFESAAQVAELLEGCLAHVQQPAAIPLPEAVAALAPKKTRRPPIGKFIAAAAGAFALFAGILIVLELDKGTLTIESELDDVPIRIMQGDEVVKSLTVSKEGATTRIGAGKYVVQIGQDFDKAVIKDGGVELSRGATAIVKVTQTNAEPAEDEKAKDEAEKAWLRRPVVGSFHDGKSFQLAGHDGLFHCVMTNNSEALNRLLTVDKYDLDFSPGNGQWTLLQTALQRSCLETTSLLLRHGANPNFASKGTPLPLELAKRSGRKELVALVQKYLESNPTTSRTNIDVRQIFADIDGEVTKILVGHNSVVMKGQELLGMRNDELKLELTKTADQMKESSAQLDGITKKIQDNKDLSIDEVIKMEKDRSELQKHVAALSVQLKKLKDRCELLYVKSTVDGKVITKNVEQLLKNRSVVAGQVLLEIAIEPSRKFTETSSDSIEARTDGRFGTLKIIEPSSLEDAVTKFNLLAKAHPLGRTQPELTVEEMTAAFRLWIASDECNEATRKDFQLVLDTRMLRPGHILQFNTKFETDGHLFEVWTIQFGDDKSYAWFKIRDSKLLSRLKTDEERKAWEQRIDQMKKSFHEYKRRGDTPKAYDTNPAWTAQTSSTEFALGEGPDIAELLETAAKHEEWVSKIGSVHFRAKGKNVQSEKALEVERAKLIARDADAVVPIKSPSLLPSFEFSDEIAWDGKQVASIRKYSLGLDNSHWVWDGTQFTTFQDGTNAAYNRSDWTWIETLSADAIPDLE